MINLNHLSDKTKRVFIKLANTKINFIEKFVLVGGSGLSLYLGHRKSEDLDFFSFKNFRDKEKIFELSNFFEFEILNEYKDGIDLLLDNVKVTFFNAGYDFLKDSVIIYKNLKIASIKNIAALKVNTLFVRATFRDYYDLYVLIYEERINLYSLYEYSKKIIKGLNFKLFSMALIYTEDIEDDNILHFEPKYNITKEDISKFFVQELRKINEKYICK